MANATLLRVNLGQDESSMAMAIRGVYGDDIQVSIVKSLLDSGRYVPVATFQGYEADAEELFDVINTKTDQYMTVGDVILWDNGKREIPLSKGWQTI